MGIEWHCTECAHKCMATSRTALKGYEARHCPPNVKAVWYQPGQITEEQFRVWFWSAMEDFIAMAYRPPGLDKLRDSEAWRGFDAVLSSLDCRKQFLNNESYD